MNFEDNRKTCYTKEDILPVLGNLLFSYSHEKNRMVSGIISQEIGTRFLFIQFVAIVMRMTLSCSIYIPFLECILRVKKFCVYYSFQRSINT